MLRSPARRSQNSPCRVTDSLSGRRAKSPPARPMRAPAVPAHCRVRRRDRCAHRPRRQALWNRIRRRAARELERAVPVPGRRRTQWQRAAAARWRSTPASDRRSRAASRWRARTPATRARASTAASFATSRPRWIFSTRPWPRSPWSPRRSSRSTTASRSEHAYFVGCSTGGREAMMMSQRFPNYFDGIVAAAPAARTSFSNLGLRYATAALKPSRRAMQTASRDPRRVERCGSQAGRSTACSRPATHSTATSDGLIFAPQNCQFDPGTLPARRQKDAASPRRR